MGLFLDLLKGIKPGAQVAATVPAAEDLAKDALAYENAVKFLNQQHIAVPGDKQAAVDAAMQGGWQGAPVRLNAAAKKDFYEAGEAKWPPAAQPVPPQTQQPGVTTFINQLQQWMQPASNLPPPIPRQGGQPARITVRPPGPPVPANPMAQPAPPLPRLPTGLPQRGAAPYVPTPPQIRQGLNALPTSQQPAIRPGQGTTSFFEAIKQAQRRRAAQPLPPPGRGPGPDLYSGMVKTAPFQRPGGHVEGGFYRDPKTKQRWYIKTEKDRPGGPTGAELARNEALANRLYKVAGVAVPDIEVRGAQIRTKAWEKQDVKQLSKLSMREAAAYDKAIQEDFYADLWLENTDIHEGNILVNPNDPKKILRIDPGGALEYLGMGIPKTKGGLPITSDAETMEYQLRYIDAFRNMTPDQNRASAEKLRKITRAGVEEAMRQYGPADPIARRNYVNLLMRRRNNIIEQFQAASGVSDPKLRAQIFGQQTPMFAKDVKQSSPLIGGYSGSRPYLAGFSDEETALRENSKWGRLDKKDIMPLIASTRDYMWHDAKGAEIDVITNMQGNATLRDILKQARDKYYPGVIIDNVKLGGKNQTVWLNMDAPLLRKAGAKFDPARMHINNLLATGAAIAVPAALVAASGEARAEESPAEANKKQPVISSDGKYRQFFYKDKPYAVPVDMSDADALAYTKAREKADNAAAGIPGPDTSYKGELNKLMMESRESLMSGLSSLFGDKLPEEPPDWVKRVAKDDGKEFTANEKWAWQKLSGAGEVLNGALGAFFNFGKAGMYAYIDQSNVSDESKEALKIISDWAMPAGGAGALLKAGKFIKAAQASQSASKVAKVRDGFKAILSPDKVDDDARAAAALIREKTGEAARSTAASAAALKEEYKGPVIGAIKNIWQNYERKINAMTEPDQLKLIDYMQTRSKGAILHDPELQAFADEFRNAMEQREIKLAQTPKLAAAHMQEDYVSQYWKDPIAAKAFVNKWMGKQGAGGALKKKKWPTYRDGINAGLKPLTTNPVEIARRYMQSMDRFIAHTEIMEAGRAAGSVKFFTPGEKLARRYEAAGWVKLDGILARKQTPKGKILQAYAPENWARPYNNTVSKGVYGFQDRIWGNAYDAMRNASNVMTQWELGFSGFHLVNIVWEAIASPTALAVSQTMGGVEKGIKGDVTGALKLLGGATKTAATALARPVTGAIRGHKLEQLYLNRMLATRAIDKELVNLFTKAGGRLGRISSPDYTFSAAGSFFDAFKRGTALKEIGQDFTQHSKVYALGKQVGRVMQTVVQPLFDKYIPKMKLAAFSENMQAYLRANPLASDAEKAAAARKILDSIDNRFGEMVQDNLFWNAGMRQSANLGLLAFSWTYGTIREVGGGMLAGVKNPRAISLASKDYDPRVGYVIGLPIAAFFVSNIYTYLKTGQMPKNFDDALDNTFAPKTGGTSPGLGGRGQVPERAALPGNTKDILGWYNDFHNEAYNKMGPLAKAVTEMILTGKDWQGKDIRLHDWSDAPGWIEDYFDYLKKFQPISVQSLEQGQKRGSKITTGESLFGIRPAPMWEQDPQGMANFLRRRQQIERQQRQRSQTRQQNIYGGPQE